MKVDYYDNKGKKQTSKVELDDSVFGVKVNNTLLSQYVYVYLSNQRQSNAHTKDRGAVSGGGKKPFRQKGTGRARAGSNRSPIWVGGGVTFGPTNEKNFKKSMNKKMKKAAFKSALTLKTSEGKVVVMDNLKVSKTKDLKAILSATKIEGKLTIVQNEEDGVNKTANNIKDVNVIRIGELNTYDVLNSGTMIILKDSIDTLVKKNK